MMVLPAADVQVVDTWTVSGLSGTGSHDFTVDDVAVPEAMAFSIFDEGGAEGPLGRIPELTWSSLAFATVAVGIAEGALEEVTTLATTKVPMFANGELASNPLFRNQLGEADALLRAARTLVASDAAAAWARAVADEPFTPVLRAELRASAVWATRAAAAVVDTAYTAGGGSALYATSPLQRRLRDVHAFTQHFALKPTPTRSPVRCSPARTSTSASCRPACRPARLARRAGRAQRLSRPPGPARGPGGRCAATTAAGGRGPPRRRRRPPWPGRR
jgi:alkylation response protein AidB-like acyl-CoA dehydrogenase